MPCISTPLGTARLNAKNVKFSKIFRGETWSSFYAGEASRKLIEDNNKIRRDEPTNPSLTRKHKSG